MAWGGEWWVEPAQPPLGALVGGYCKGWGFFLAAKRAELEVEDLRPWWTQPACGLDFGDGGRGLSFFVQPEPLDEVKRARCAGNGLSSQGPTEALAIL